MNSLSRYQQLNPLERGLLFKELKEKQKLSYRQIARQIGKSPAYVVNSVRLLTLPEAIKDGLVGGLITEGHARALLALDDFRQAIEVYKTVLKTHASVRQTEELVRQVRQQLQQQRQINWLKVKALIEDFLGERFVSIKVRQSRRRLTLIFDR